MISFRQRIEAMIKEVEIKRDKHEMKYVSHHYGTLVHAMTRFNVAICGLKISILKDLLRLKE
jgi:hypothetical protein